MDTKDLLNKAQNFIKENQETIKQKAPGVIEKAQTFIKDNQETIKQKAPGVLDKVKTGLGGLFSKKK